jgi:hypothetical protein
VGENNKLRGVKGDGTQHLSASSFPSMVFSPSNEDRLQDLDANLNRELDQQHVVREGCILNRKSVRCLSRNQNLLLCFYFAFFAAFTWARFYQFKTGKEIRKTGSLLYLSSSLCNFVYEILMLGVFVRLFGLLSDEYFRVE